MPKNILPNIRSSSEVYATLASTKLKGIPISGASYAHSGVGLFALYRSWAINKLHL